MDDISLTNIGELVSFDKIVLSILILLVAWSLVQGLYWLSQQLSAKYARYRMAIARFFPAIKIGIWAVATYWVVVRVVNPPEKTTLAMLASVGLAVGLAAQDLVKNVISGLLILVDKPYGVGDMIEVGGHYGEVVRIDLRSTRICTFDDTIVTLPNSTLLTQALANSNSGAIDEMIAMKFNVPATVDVRELRELAWDAAASSPYVLLKKPILVNIEDLFDRTFLTRVIVKCYVIDVRLERVMASDIVERVKSALLERKLITKETVDGLLKLSD